MNFSTRNYPLGYLSVIATTLKFFIDWRTAEPVSFTSFSLAWDKSKTSDRINGKHIIWATYLHIKGEESKYLDRVKLENNSYFLICRIIVPNTFCMWTRYILPPRPNLQMYSPNNFLNHTAFPLTKESLREKKPGLI